MESIIQRSFRVNLILMRLFNLYPPDNPTLLYKLKAYFVLCTLVPSIPILGAVYIYFDESLTLEKLDDSFLIVIEMSCQFPKFLPFITQGSRIKKCILFFESSLFKLSLDKHKQIIDNCCWICRRNCIGFLVCITIAAIYFCVRPLFGSSHFPIDIWLPFETTTDVRVDVAIYMFVAAGLGYTALCSVVIDPLIGGLACLATGQLKILKDNLQNLNVYAEQMRRKSGGERSFLHEIIKKSVDQHNAILKFISEYETCFSQSVFSQMMGSVLILGFCCLQISKLTPLSLSFIVMTVLFSLAPTQVYLYCYYVSMLFEESNSLTDAVYMGQWYEYDTETKKSLLILMERSKRPVIVNAGKIVEVSIQTFATILRRSYSVWAVLRNF